MEQRGVGKDPVKTALGQLHSQEILMQDLAARMCPRHGDELLRSVKPHGFVPQGSKVMEIAAGSAAEIEDRVWWVTLDGLKECRVILADIVVPCAVPELPCEPIVISDRRFAKTPGLLWTIWT